MMESGNATVEAEFHLETESGEWVSPFAEEALWIVDFPYENAADLEVSETHARTAPLAKVQHPERATDLPGIPKLPRQRGNVQRRQKSPMLAAAVFLAKINRFSALGRVDEAIDVVILDIEKWLETSDWDACKFALLNADANRLHPAVSLAILSMTLVEKHLLKASREGFCRAVRQRLAGQYGDQEANEDLRGLD